MINCRGTGKRYPGRQHSVIYSRGRFHTTRSQRHVRKPRPTRQWYNSNYHRFHDKQNLEVTLQSRYKQRYQSRRHHTNQGRLNKYNQRSEYDNTPAKVNRSYRRQGTFKEPAQITIIGDSMIKHCKIPEVDVQSIGGLNLTRAYQLIETKEIKIKGYDVLIIHIGTVEVQRCSVTDFAKKYQDLIRLIKAQNQKCILGLSYIIQRPVDFYTGSFRGKRNENKRKLFNQEIKRLALWERCQFIKSSKPFADRYNPDEPYDPYFNQNDGIHLNRQGSDKLTNYLSGSIALLKGIWRKTLY